MGEDVVFTDRQFVRFLNGLRARLLPPNYWVWSLKSFRAHYLRGLSEKSYVLPIVAIGRTIRDKLFGRVRMKELRDGRVLVEVTPSEDSSQGDPVRLVLPTDEQSIRAISQFLDERTKLPIPDSILTRESSPTRVPVPASSPSDSRGPLEPIDFETPD